MSSVLFTILLAATSSLAEEGGRPANFPAAEAGNGIAPAEQACSVLLVEEIQGKVTVKGEGIILTRGDSMDEGDTILTGKESWVDLRHCEGSVQRVGENSEYTFEEAEPAGEVWRWAFTLLKGSLRALVKGSGEREEMKFRVRTSTASMGVRGTEFVVEAAADDTTLHTLEGEVLMGKSGDWEDLRSWKASARARFRAVGKERFSRVRRGEAASAPRRFDLQQFREKRKEMLFRGRMQKNQGFQQIVRNKQARTVFQRTRPAIQKHMEGARAQGQERRENRRQSLQNRRQNLKTNRKQEQKSEDRARGPGKQNRPGRGKEGPTRPPKRGGRGGGAGPGRR